jgi:hypothetical protein
MSRGRPSGLPDSPQPAAPRWSGSHGTAARRVFTRPCLFPPTAVIRAREIYSSSMSRSARKRAVVLGAAPRSSRRSGGFLTVLLVGALLLCHGVLGFAHEISCHECDSSDLLASVPPAGHEHGPPGHAAGDDPAGGHMFPGYFGIVLALFGVAALGLLPGARRWHGISSSQLYRSRPLPTFAPLPRGPTLPLLQVFRL